jgi:Hexokinase
MLVSVTNSPLPSPPLRCKQSSLWTLTHPVSVAPFSVCLYCVLLIDKGSCEAETSCVCSVFRDIFTYLQLFDHIAECLANFMKEHSVQAERLPLGFTFSFPLTQKGLTKGLLERWTKGFNCSGCVGEDVVQQLKDALARRNVSSGTARTYWLPC